MFTGGSLEVSDGPPTLQSLRVTYVCGVKQLTCPTPPRCASPTISLSSLSWLGGALWWCAVAAHPHTRHRW